MKYSLKSQVGFYNCFDPIVHVHKDELTFDSSLTALTTGASVAVENRLEHVFALQQCQYRIAIS